MYSSLADDVIIEILKLQLEAQGMPSLSIIEGKGIALRYYTATKVIIIMLLFFIIYLVLIMLCLVIFYCTESH